MVLVGECNVHSIDGCNNCWDCENDRDCSEKFDCFIDVVCEDDVIGVSKRADALDVDPTHIFRLAHCDHEIFKEF